MRKKRRTVPEPQPADPRITYVRQARSECPRQRFNERALEAPPVAIDRDFCFSEDEQA